MPLPTNIAGSYPDRGPGDLAHQEHHDTVHAAVNEVNEGRLTEAALSATYAKKDQPTQVRAMTVYEEWTEQNKRVLYQNGATIYATTGPSGTIVKSTDRGATWTSKGNSGQANAPFLLRVEATGTLLMNKAPSNILRSTDDGVTWTDLGPMNDGNAGPLNANGVAETPSGALLWAEYTSGADGGAASTCRILRSTDDGVTWAPVLNAAGTGHFHSVVYDKYADKFIAFLDRTVDASIYGTHYVSNDDGATWSVLGVATTATHPNWVAPMIFQDYIAWGYDNERNGIIARIPKVAYYAGDFSKVEDVAQLNNKVFYGVMPVREDTWVVSMATELVGTQPLGPGGYAEELHIVYNNGSRVVGGVQHMTPNSTPFVLRGYKSGLPAYPHNVYDHKGESWANFNTDFLPSSVAAVPYSVGWAAGPLPRTSPSLPLTSPLLRNNAPSLARRVAGGTAQWMMFDNSDRLRIFNTANAGIPEIRFNTSGYGIDFLYNGARVMALASNEILVATGIPIKFGSATGPSISGGAGTPEGAVTARPGSLYLRSDGGTGTSMYVKETGVGNTGWVAK